MSGIDIGKEDVFLLSQSPKKLQKSRETVRRYIENGVLNRTTGATVYMEKIDLPEGRATSVEAYHRFIRAINGLDADGGE